MNLSLIGTISKSALSPETWPFGLEFLPETAYLVGGNVRDALLGRWADYLDLDFVLPSRVVETARAIAHHYQAGFVLLDAERQIARVVFENATVDFAQQVGPDLESDLRRRDFTINAIAYHPLTQDIVDPLQGCIDLQKQLIRMIAPENLQDDPLRLLRAYRQAAQLGFSLEPETEITIRDLAPLLETVAAERVQAELNYLLSSTQGTEFLDQAWRDRVLRPWLPHANAQSLNGLRQIDAAAIALDTRWPAFGSELTHWMRDQSRASRSKRSWLKVAKLASLVAPDPNLAEHELWTLKYSRAEIQSVLKILKCLPCLQIPQLRDLSLRERYILFKEVGAVFPPLAVYAVASGVAIEAIAPLIEHFLDPSDPVAHPVPLLTGRDLMQGLHLPASPQIGTLLEAIQVARAEGNVHTADDALHFAKRLIATDGAL